MVPDCSRPTWCAWQYSPPATGLMHSDHLQPGSNRIRDAATPPIRTISTVVLSGVRVSSGEPKSPTSTLAMSDSLAPYMQPDESDPTTSVGASSSPPRDG